MDDSSVLTIRQARKQYGNGCVAVDDLSLSLGRGEVFGLLGPNGSGKTTTILMLLGLTEPTSGSVDMLGFDPLRSPLEIKRRVAYMPDTIGFYDELSAFENLDYTARFLGLDADARRGRIEESIKKMHLEERMYDKVSTFSHGMRRRLGLAEVLVKKPEIAVLDEPTQGLDPESAAEFLDLILELKQREGITILLSSHLLNQVQAVCDRVGLFSAGRLLVCGAVDELAAGIFGGSVSTFLKAGPDDLSETLRRVEGVSSVERHADGSYRIESSGEVRPALAEAVVAGGGKIYELSSSEHDLDSIYRAYYKEVSHAAA
ncbi:ABC transporter ATP-binding protein [Sediminispirochaeta bajacaliforniensis]|uniref:ABC transporter ATP-binding protein n=1 Tax=Sediminispirochaeta bajacaliforniensis TaxID=148 RepID=UPI000367C1F0|nr:ABC transporter ATP-binding protein [Sediminispirochaeta bajacaliforniensis]